MFLGLMCISVLASSCNQAREEANKVINQTNESVQKVIDDLGLVYVEEGAQAVITYDEVNAAEQAWCDALVQIGKLKEEGGDYKAYAEKCFLRLIIMTKERYFLSQL